MAVNFSGADAEIINNTRFTSNIHQAKLMYWDSSKEKSREKLLPFFWNVIGKEGQLYGNRGHKNRFQVTNVQMPYPGYDEIFTGLADIQTFSNERKNN